MKQYLFFKTFDAKKPVSLHDLSEILDSVHEETERFVAEMTQGKVLAPPIEAGLEVSNDRIEVRLEIKLVISPLSPLFGREEDVANKIATRFFEIFEKKLREEGYV